MKRGAWAAIAALVVSACGGAPSDPASRAPSSDASFERVAAGGYRPLVAKAMLDVRYGARARDALELRAPESGVSVRFSLDDATDAPAELVGGAVVYRKGHASGADVVHKADLRGTEDHLHFAKETSTDVTYTLGLGEGAKAVRFLHGFVEILDAEGMPRLRMDPPFVVDARRAKHPATVALSGCAFDADPRSPRGRRLVSPGSSSCKVRISWAAGLAHPLVLDPAWKSAGVMAHKRDKHTMTELEDGSFLVAGGTQDGSTVAELYLPPAPTAFGDKGAFTLTGANTYTQEPKLHTATRVAGNKVLLYGGIHENEAGNITSTAPYASLYDGATGTFSALPQLSQARFAHTASLLPDGRVLLAGGAHAFSTAASDTVIFTPPASFSAGPSLLTGRSFHAAVTTLDGAVFLSGGSTSASQASGAALASTERLVAGGTSFVLGPPMSTPRVVHTATTLPDGRVLVAGGIDSVAGPTTTGDVEIWTPGAGGGAWKPIGALMFNRAAHTATLLADGRVLLVAGFGAVPTIPNAELYAVSATSGAATTIGDPLNGRAYHTTAWLGGLRAIAVGGISFTTPTDIAEIFDRYPTGTPCVDAGDCDSGFCTDGVCCEASCTGACEACTQAVRGTTLADGVCGPIAEKATARPGGTCIDVTTQNPCGDTGTCDGKGACRRKPLGTQCGASVCKPPVVMIAACDGKGSCTTLPNCGYYANCASDTACDSSCTKPSDCTANAFCGAGECRKKGDPGELCDAKFGGADCASGHCVDGVCCNETCEGTCKSCRADQQESGKDGFCGFVKPGVDPRDDCPKDPPSSCQSTGVCDGKGACERYGSTVACGAGATCSSDAMGGPAVYALGCNAGACLPGAPTSCGAYACNAQATGCNTECATNADCSASAYCEAKVCVAQKPNGETCTLAKQCQSGVCADGVCCSTACSGQCESCVAKGSVGTCVAVVGPAPAGRPACPTGATDVCQAARCDGVTRTKCAGLVGDEVSCAAAACEGDVLSAGSVCGGGHCKEPVKVDCAPYGCAGAACRSSCASDADCSLGARCEGGVCTAFAACVDPTTLRLVDGTKKSCGVYKCDQANRTCRSTCASSVDCAAGSVCLADGQCGPALSASAEAAASCSVGGRPTAGFGLGVLLVLGGILARLRRLAPVPVLAAAACSGTEDSGGDRPAAALSPSPASPPAETLAVTMPSRADEPLVVRDRASHVGVRASLVGARPVPFVDGDAGRFFAGATGHGAMWVRRSGPEVEDFVQVADTRKIPELRYVLALEAVAGLRLVDDVLELLDGTGAPRLRANRPWLRDEKGAIHRAQYEVEGCAVDRSPVGPWGRPPTPPGADACTLVVRLPAVDGPVLVDPGWSPTGNMIIARGGHAATLLANGKVLLSGGADQLVQGNNFAASDLYDPATGTFAVTGALPAGRGKHLQVQLPDGRAFVFGGEASPSSEEAFSPIYDPTLGTWSNCGALPGGGAYTHAGALLDDGRVVMAGGYRFATNAVSASTFTHDATTCTWTTHASMSTKRRYHVGSKLPDGRFLVAFGVTANASNVESLSSTTEIWDPVGDAWSPGPPIAVQRRYPALIPTPSGFLVAGGVTGLPVAAVESYSFATGTWTTLPPLKKPRIGLGGAYVPALSRPLVAGGYDFAGPAQQSELFDAGQNDWLSAGLNSDPRAFPTVTLLNDGRVLLAGGGQLVFGMFQGLLKSAEVFAPGALGDACNGPGLCGSGFCVDGVCCDGACTGKCEACSAMAKGQGTNGTCGFVTKGQDPDGDCPAQDAATCGTTGTCDGAGQCQKFDDGTTCAASCAGAIISAGSCTGGSCVVSQTSCLPYACKNDTCFTSCVTAAECAPGGACVGGKCTLDKQPDGSPCIDATTCNSGFCIDGVCCGTKCGEACHSCKASAQDPAMAPKDGECKPANPANADPHGLCLDSGPLCKAKGICASGGTCVTYKDGDTCFPSACSGSQKVGYAVSGFACKGGQCTAGKPVTCGLSVCASGACLGSCKDDTECTASARCLGGKCQERLGNGKGCQKDGDCLSGFCTDGVCCLSRCDGQCSSCAEKGQEGVCLAVSGAPRGARLPCDKGETTCLARNCDGIDPAACAGFVASSTVCRKAACENGRETYEAVCNGKGQCGEDVSKACAPYACGETACKTSCTGDGDCQKGARCTQGTCVALPVCDESILKDATGKVVADCGLYRCNPDEGNCRTTCRATLDCKKGATCAADGKCKPAEQEGEVDAGCGCEVPGRRAPALASLSPLAVAFAALLARARRRSKATR